MSARMKPFPVPIAAAAALMVAAPLPAIGAPTTTTSATRPPSVGGVGLANPTTGTAQTQRTTPPRTPALVGAPASAHPTPQTPPPAPAPAARPHPPARARQRGGRCLAGARMRRLGNSGAPRGRATLVAFL